MRDICFCCKKESDHLTGIEVSYKVVEVEGGTKGESEWRYVCPKCNKLKKGGSDDSK